MTKKAPVKATYKTSEEHMGDMTLTKVEVQAEDGRRFYGEVRWDKREPAEEYGEGDDFGLSYQEACDFASSIACVYEDGHTIDDVDAFIKEHKN
jgi:hypothetical protein